LSAEAQRRFQNAQTERIRRVGHDFGARDKHGRADCHAGGEEFLTPEFVFGVGFRLGGVDIAPLCGTLDAAEGVVADSSDGLVKVGERR
jgi:hypothetical protein